jgi:hypothetical protein
MPDNDLKKLAKAFDTPDDPILLMKGRSVKRGAEGAIRFLTHMARRSTGRR